MSHDDIHILIYIYIYIQPSDSVEIKNVRRFESIEHLIDYLLQKFLTSDLPLV